MGRIRADDGGEHDARGPYGEALRRLSRKPLTEDELRRGLAQAGHASAAIDDVLERLRRERYVDDHELARQYIVTRSRRLGHAPQRLVEELERRGVERQVAQSAWRAAVEEEALDVPALLREQVRRHLRSCGGRLEGRAYRRVYNALLRAGFEGRAITEALAPYRSADDAGMAEGIQDDVS